MTGARREVQEETGYAVEDAVQALAPRKQAGGKIVHAWAVEGDCDSSAITSNTLSMGWPPRRSGRMQSFPEVDRADWFALNVSRVKIHKCKVGFLHEFEERLATAADPGRS